LLSSFYWNEQKKQVDFEGMKPLALALWTTSRTNIM
jgi:hypothetical protein